MRGRSCIIGLIAIALSVICVPNIFAPAPTTYSYDPASQGPLEIDISGSVDATVTIGVAWSGSEPSDWSFGTEMRAVSVPPGWGVSFVPGTFTLSKSGQPTQDVTVTITAPIGTEACTTKDVRVKAHCTTPGGGTPGEGDGCLISAHVRIFVIPESQTGTIGTIAAATIGITLFGILRKKFNLMKI